MKPYHLKRFAALALATLLGGSAVHAIKITVPKQYEAQVEAINEAERAEIERQIGSVESGESTTPAQDDGGMQFGTGDNREGESTAPDAAPQSGPSDPLAQSLAEATKTAEAFELEAPEGQGFVSGQIVDKDSGQPLPGVAILIEGTEVATITDAEGRYTLGPAPAGDYTVNFFKSGYIEANVTDFTVAADEVSVFPFALPPRPAEMSDEVYVLQDFSVTADEANDMMLMLDLQMNSDNLLSALSSEDFSKFAASDIGEAIQRVSGVSVVGGKYAVIRGLGDRYVSSTLNGLPIASPDPDRQAVQLDLFPSGLFDSLEVTKTYTPDQSANSTGGINMKVKELPDEFFATLSTGVGGHSIATGNDDFLTSDRVTSQDRWADGADERALPAGATEFPAALNAPVFPIPGVTPGPPFVTQAEKDAAVAEANVITNSLGRNMHAFGDTPELDHSFKFSMGDSRLFMDDRLRVGAIGGVNYSRKARMIEDAEYFRRATKQSGANTLSPSTFLDPNAEGVYENKLRTVSTYTSVFSWLLGFGVELDEDHSIRVHRLDLKISEDEVTRVRGEVFNEFAGDLGYSSNIAQEFSESLHYQERRLISDQILGNHRFDLPTDLFWDELDFRWAYSEDTASQDEPGFIQTRALLYADGSKFTITQNPSSPTEPETQFAIWREISEERESKKVDLALKRGANEAFDSNLKFGFLQTSADRNVLDAFLSFRGTNLAKPTQGVEIDPGDLEDSPFENFDTLQASGYEVSADVDLFTESDGRYFMLDQTLFEKFRIIGGYRHEKNSADVRVNGELKLRGAGSSGNPLSDLPTEGGYEVEDWYPGISFIFSPTDSIRIRLAYSNTIALPSAREVSPYASSSFQGSDVDVGNPELQPSNVDSLDMGISYVSEAGDSVSLTVFRKTVTGRIEKLNGLGVDKFEPVVDNDPFNLMNYPKRFVRSQNILGGATLLSWYNNPNDAELTGIEVDARKNLGFIHDSLSSFSIGGNFTYIDGEVDRFPIEIAGKNSVNRPVSETRGLTEQPSSIFNLDLTYDDPDLGLQVSLIYYRISDVLESVSLFDTYDFYRQAYDQVDLTISKEIGEHFSMSFSAKNITDSIRETYYDVEGFERSGDSYHVGTSFSISGSYQF